jgi:RNA polymerase sigma-70 factor (ECF subfamily)
MLRLDPPVAGAAADAPGEGSRGDARLLERLRRGDGAAFTELVEQYGGRLLAVARRVLRSEDDARDAVQDAFLSAFRGLAAFKGDAKVSTWLHRIVINAALMRLRSRKYRSEQSIDDLLPSFDDEGYWDAALRPVAESSHELLERRESRALVRGCIERLPDTYRTVLVMRDIEDLDTEEVAERLGVTPNAVKIRLHRARQALRSLIEQAQQRVEALPSTEAAASRSPLATAGA